MEKVIGNVYETLENVLEERKQYEKHIKELETEIKEHNKEIRQINKDVKELEENSAEVATLQARKEEIAQKQKEIQDRIPKLQAMFDGTYQKAMQQIQGAIQTQEPTGNEFVEELKNALIATHEEEKNKLLEIQTKIEGLEKLNRAEMPDSFRERLQAQIKELTESSQAIQASFTTRRETIQLKIEEMQKQTAPTEGNGEQNVVKEIVEAMQADDWKLAEKLWKPIKKEAEKEKKEESMKKEHIEETQANVENIKETTTGVEENETTQKIEEVETVKENIQEIQETPEPTPTKKIVEEPPVQTIQEEKPIAPNNKNAQNISAIFIDMMSEKIYADIGQNEGKEYNFEMEMQPSMLNKETTLSIFRKHIPNFDRIVTEKEKGQASEKAEEDYNRYMEIFTKADPFVVAVLQQNHDDLRNYLKAIKNHNKEEMPCELYYNLQKVTQTQFEETEQDQIIETTEQNAHLATQIRGLSKAKRARNWRKFENKHTILRAFMRWLRMEENVKQLTDGK